VRGRDLLTALGAGDPAKVAALIEAGATLGARDEHGYDALLNAVHGRDVLRDPRLIELLELLVANGAELNAISRYAESGLRVLSRLGRFDAVEVLLRAGADEAQLAWTPLIRAVALGSLSEVEELARDPAALEGRDWWKRTPWLVALQVGDLAKARLLRERGADVNARGRCGKPPLFYPIGNHHPGVLRWLLEIGQGVEQADEFGATPLREAVDNDDLECVMVLLAAGADIHHVHNGDTPLGAVRSREIAMRLLERGADPAALRNEGRRAILGLPPDADESLLEASPAEFAAGRAPRFGTRNPQRMDLPFWRAMVRSGVNGYAATQHFKGPSSCDAGPVWCAQRFGQSITFLPDGRVVLIGGEHEDSYDPDFCIYNDVVVQEPDGSIVIFGYPETVFPPTDFHTATLAGSAVYVIGSLGYWGKRRFGGTPVYKVDTRDLSIERVSTTGEPPGWLYGHRATLVSNHEIRVEGGTLLQLAAGKEAHAENTAAFILDVRRGVWRPA
jgi:ankyrin repeat protein